MAFSPEAFFHKLFTDHMIEDFVTMANLYALQSGRDGWKTLTREEFKTFSCIIL